MIYSANQKNPFRWIGYHDPDDKRYIGLIFKPSTWTANTVYEKRNDDDFDIVLPTVYTGFYYKVITPGKSTTVEPTWVAEDGEETVQTGTSLVFKAVNYNLMPVGENVSSISYACTHGATVSSSSSDSSSCQFMIDPLPAEAIAAKSFVVTATVIKSNGEQFDVSLEFRVK